MLPATRDAFVERVGEFFSRLGHQRIAGRLIGWLLISEPEHQSAAELVEVIGASKASITEVPISTNEGFDYKHLYFIALHDFQVASF